MFWTEEIKNLKVDEVKYSPLKEYMQKHNIKEIEKFKLPLDNKREEVADKIKNLVNKNDKSSYRQIDKYEKGISNILKDYKNINDAFLGIVENTQMRNLVNRYKVSEFDILNFGWKIDTEKLLYDFLCWKKCAYDFLGEILSGKVVIKLKKENESETIIYKDHQNGEYTLETSKYTESGEYKNGVKSGICWRNIGGEKKKYRHLNGRVVRPDIIRKFTEIDTRRVNLDPYDENMLFDLTKGHWEIGEEEVKAIEKEVGEKAYQGDPIKDTKSDAVIGIDFGTKSTVVVSKIDNETRPIRIGGNRLFDGMAERDFENPTIIDFNDITQFWEQYNKKIGRPETSWEDVSVSYTAKSNLENGQSTYSIIDELKQWAGSKTKKLKIKDSKDCEIEISPFVELKDGGIDPIEIYAYYIGSYINNMRNGVYLRYELSFPATFKKELRSKVLQSFEKGIKKSLPVQILKNDEIMKKFGVRGGTVEPAAYIITAIDEYGIYDKNEKTNYGVFDFGGGTTDFDFGIITRVEDSFEYDARLEHFDVGGLAHLGGENILKKMAYEMFKDNRETLTKNKIRFARPENCKLFTGHEILLDDSRNATLNIKFLAEKLREYWENKIELDENENENKEISCMLYNVNGTEITLQLKIDKKKLDEIIKSEIENGIESFEIKLRESFENRLEKDKKIAVFLAGNSSKHHYVQKGFKELKDKIGKDYELTIYPPLGSEESKEFMKQDLVGDYRPNGKTGVAFGLVNCDRIEIINLDEKNNSKDGKDQITFKYYVGYETHKKFKVVATPKTNYGTPVQIGIVRDSRFKISYTDVPQTREKPSSIDVAKVKIIDFDMSKVQKGQAIFIAPKDVEKLMWYVCDKDKNPEKDYVDCGEIDLGE